MKHLAPSLFALALATALPMAHAQQQPAPAVPGYAHGQHTLAKAPYTLVDLQALQKSLLFTDEDVKALRQSKAILADQTRAVEKALVEYGRELGLAFQLVDDALDYSANPGELGKQLGDDLAEGKPTLPLIFALQRGSPREQVMIRRAIEQGGREDIRPIQEAIVSAGALAYTAAKARESAIRARAALAPVPDSPFKGALAGLADFAVERRY